MGVFVLLLVVFRSGMLVGYRKAVFSFGAGDNYYKIFTNPRDKDKFGPQGFMRDNFPSAHGVVGKIIQVTLPKIVVEGVDGIEKVVSLQNDTVIKQFQESLAPTDLRVKDFVVVLGTPSNDGYIQAKFIRLMPAPDGLPFPNDVKSNLINK